MKFRKIAAVLTAAAITLGCGCEVRSSNAAAWPTGSVENKEELTVTVDDFNKEYENVAAATLIFEEHLPPFEKTWDNYVPQMFEAAAKSCGVTAEIGSFHAGAETHIYANNLNARGEKFIPFLVGLANVHNMHCPAENVDYKSMVKGQEVLRKFFEDFNR